MADMALDLAKTAVEGTVSRVLAAIDEDTKQKTVGRQDLRFIVDEFQMMQSFLEMVHDNKKHRSNKVVKMWVRQLRQLAFDVEDCAEFVTHLDTTSAKIWWSWVWRVLPLPSCMTPAWVENLFQAFAQLKELKARVDEVSQRNTRYNLLGGDDSGSSTAPPPVPTGQLIDASAYPSTVNILRDLWKDKAKQSSSYKCNLQYLVTDRWSNDLKVILLCRSAGVDLEAANILNAAYCDPEICKEFKARARVKLMHPFNIQEFLKSLLNQLYVTSQQRDIPGADELSPGGHTSVVQDDLRQLLSKHKYLIILEGLSSSVEWDLIRFFLPDLHNGSRIVISTEQLGFALWCIGEPYRVFQLALFPNDGYIYAFNNKPSSIGMKQLVRQIARCRVISLWEDKIGDTSSVVRDVYEAIRKNNTTEFKGLNFMFFEWVNVPSPFSLECFCRRLPQYGYYGYNDPERYLDGLWRNQACEYRNLIVVEGLQSKEDWDLIKDAGGLVPEDTKSCIIIIANEEAVAKHCHDDSLRKMDEEEREQANRAAIIGPLFAQKLPSIGITELIRQFGQRRVISLWGNEDGDTASLVRVVCEAIINKSAQFKGVNLEGLWWVNVPSPFNLEVFCRCLPGYITAGYENHPKSYFARCWSNIVRTTRSIIVINGLQSMKDWDEIKDALVPEDTKSCIVIITYQEAVAKHCQDNSWRKMDNNEQEEAKNAAIIGPLFKQKDQYYSLGDNDRFRSHDCLRRIEEALFHFAQFITLDQYNLLARMIISHTHQYAVHAVWGGTGVGKSTLLRFVYYTVMAYSLKVFEYDNLPNREELYLCGMRDLVSFERFGWVDVPEPFDLAEFSRRLLLDFNSYDRGEMEKAAIDIIQGHNPIQQCYKTIHNHKCLVVIDGVRSIQDWDSIKQVFFCHHHLKSCIFVITIDEGIAKRIKNGNGTIQITGLDEKSSLDLFTKVADKRKQWDNKWTTEQKLKHAKRIVPKCGGLPKIIDAVAKSDRSFWENINDDLVTKLKNDPQFGHLRGVLSWMHSYFDGCSDSVKPCVFYLSVFPTNYKIRKAHLLRRWIAEGYSRDTTDCSAKENAERLFDELVKLNIIQELPSMPLCQTNGFFREYIISQPMEDNLVFALEGHCKPNLQRTGQHLTIMESWERKQRNVFESIDVSRLRSLTVYGEWQSFFISDNKMKRIRVLDLEGTSGLEDDELKRIFGILLSLKFISLRGCKSIKCLPKTLGGLRQLESLDVRGTSIVTLPQSITRLKKIQYIRAGMFLPFEDWISATSEDDSVDMVGNQPSLTTSTPEAEGSDGGVVATSLPQATILHDKEVDGARQKKLAQRCWTSTKSSRLSPSKLCSWFNDNDIINGGVEVPKGIEDMPALHTLGTVNIKSAGGKDFLTKLQGKKKHTQKKASGGKDFVTTMPQLLKLSLRGINKENWKDLCDALSAHDHLESLSLGLDEEFTEDSCFDNPPKALKSIKVYGHIHKLPACCSWIKDRSLVANLKKFDLEVIISSQEGMDQLVESLPCTGIPLRLCIKPIDQVTKLEFKQCHNNIKVQMLKIDCSSKLQVAFDENSIGRQVNVLIIHCPEGSEFRINSWNEKSGLNGLNTVWLKGYDEKAEYVAHLKEQVGKLKECKPAFKFEKLKSA